MAPLNVSRSTSTGGSNANNYLSRPEDPPPVGDCVRARRLVRVAYPPAGTARRDSSEGPPWPPRLFERLPILRLRRRRTHGQTALEGRAARLGHARSAFAFCR